MAYEKKSKGTTSEVLTRETTIHMHKNIHSRSFKKRAPFAIKSIKAAALTMMGTEDVRIDPKLNKSIWSRGVKNVPRRIRVRFSRRRNEEEGAKHMLYTIATFVPVASFKGLQTETIDA